MADQNGQLAGYIRSKGYAAESRIILVEGTTDLDLFTLAARMEIKASGVNILKDLAIIPAGEGDSGGTNGVIRELIACRAFANRDLSSTGSRRYRIIALFDNDKSGRQALRLACQLDLTIIECKDVFLLFPEMPQTSNLDVASMKRMFDDANREFRAIDWELEDLLPESFLEAFEDEHGTIRKTSAGGRIHRDFTAESKARFHRFLKQNAVHADMAGVINLIRSLRSCVNLR